MSEVQLYLEDIEKDESDHCKKSAQLLTGEIEKFLTKRKNIFALLNLDQQEA